MKLRKLVVAGAMAALTVLVVACSDNDAAMAPMSLKQFAVDDLSNNTNDSAIALEINDWAIDTSSEDATLFDDLLQSM